MKIKGVLILFFFTCFDIVLAQPRVDGQQKYKVLKSSPVVTNIVGWAYDKGKEKWSGYYNMILDYYKGNNKVPAKPSVHSMSVNDNIISLQFKKIEYNNSIYYVLIKTFWDGAYHYPALQLDYYEIKERVISVYDTIEYKKLSNLSEQITSVKTIYGQSRYSASLVNYTKLNDQLMRIFNGGDLESCPTITYFKKENDNVIRFSTWKKDISDKYYEIKKSIFDTLIIK